MAPSDFDDPEPMEVGPHPHIGLATVTWLFEGEALHGDSLGTEQLIRPGQLNLMTAGRGIAHAELGVADRINGVQMWLAQPDDTRDGESRFEHHANLPVIDIGSARATVLVGGIEGISGAQFDSPAIGIDLNVRPGRCEVPVETDFEYAVVPINHPIKVGEAIVEPGWLGLIEPGTDVLPIEARDNSRVMMVGGRPMQERIQMWWNFVARTKDELAAAWRDWDIGNTDRFGPVPSDLRRIDVAPPPWLRHGDR